MKTLAAVVLCVLVAACASPVPSSFTPSLPTPTAASSAAQPSSSLTVVVPAVLTCGDLTIDDCRDAGSVVLATAERYGKATQVELGGGVWCPTPGLLFANTNCPGGAVGPPDGGQWIGHGLVTFAGSAAQAYVNVAKNGQTIRARFIALATPPPETPAPS